MVSYFRCLKSFSGLERIFVQATWPESVHLVPKADSVFYSLTKLVNIDEAIGGPEELPESMPGEIGHLDVGMGLERIYICDGCPGSVHLIPNKNSFLHYLILSFKIDDPVGEMKTDVKVTGVIWHHDFN